MDKITLFDTLKSKSMLLSSKEIQAIMDEELAKDPAEMDTELVDLCVNALSNSVQADSSVSNNKGKRVRFNKALLIAAVIIVSICIAFPATAKFVRQDASTDFVQYSKDHFKMNLQGKNNTSKNSAQANSLAKILNQNGFDNVMLPKTLLNQNYYEDDIKIDNNGLMLTADFDIEIDDVTGYASVTKYKDDSFKDKIGQLEIEKEYDTVKQIDSNGLNVFVLSSEKRTLIIYMNNNTEYEIHLNNCDAELGEIIAEAIK